MRLFPIQEVFWKHKSLPSTAFLPSLYEGPMKNKAIFPKLPIAILHSSFFLLLPSQIFICVFFVFEEEIPSDPFPMHRRLHV